MPRVVLATGGTGGHIKPAEELADVLGERAFFVGVDLETCPYFKKKKYAYRSIKGGKPTTLKGLARLFCGFLQSMTIKADLVVGFGSFHSLPMIIAAYLRRIPFILFEPNAKPGRVTRLFAKSALYTAVYFPEVSVPGKKVAIRPKMKRTSRLDAAYYYGLDPKKKTLLVYGGSQGALSLNDIFLKTELPDDIQIIHLTGRADIAERAKERYKNHVSVVKTFEERMDCAYAMADFALARAGASSVLELTYYKIPALLVPLPWAANDHQTANAKLFPGSYIAQKELTPETLHRHLFKELKAHFQECVPYPTLAETLAPIHFIGIGGVGMSALARILIEKGATVTGSDRNSSPLAKPFSPFASRVVVSTAIPKTDPELQKAQEMQLPIIHRSDLLTELASEKKALYVTGTHGKTSTSALLAHVLTHAGLDPSYAIGGFSPSLISNGHHGRGEYFVLEADESDGSFLKGKPYAAIVTNTKTDHLDYWKTPEALEKAFNTFSQNTLHLFRPLPLGSCEQKGRTLHFNLSDDHFTLPLIGLHQAENASAVFTLARHLGIATETIKEAFATYQGVKRRSEYLGTYKDALIFDDYAHHPTEIAATLTSFKKAFPDRRLIALFQPHRYSRFRDFFDDYCTCFTSADALFTMPVYPAGEKPLAHPTPEDLLKRLIKPKMRYHDKSIKAQIQPGDVVVTLGAGDITKVGHDLISKNTST